MISTLKRKNITKISKIDTSFSRKQRGLFNSPDTLNYSAPQLWTFLLNEIKHRSAMGLYKSDIR